MVSCKLSENFKICWKASVVESIFSKATEEISVFYNSFENSITQIVIFRKEALLEISRNSLLNGVAGSQPTGCRATKNKRLTNLFKDILKIQENVPVKVWSFLYYIASLQITVSNIVFLKFWKIPEITSAVEFILQRWESADRFSPEQLL